jgi:hypothetical protein
MSRIVMVTLIYHRHKPIRSGFMWLGLELSRVTL